MFGFFGFVAHYESRATVERELALRLIAVAQAAAATLSAPELRFLEPGDEGTRTHKSLRRRLSSLEEATGVGRIYVFDPDLKSRVDTKEGVSIGRRYYHLEVERSVIDRVLERGQGSSLLYEANEKLYKTGYAVIRDDDSEAVGVVAVEGSAEHYALLGALSRRLVIFGVAGVALLILLSGVVARRVSRPLRRLSSAAEKMGRGTLDEPIPVEGGGEVALVARSMERMRFELHRRDEHLRMMLAGIAHEVRNPLGGMELMAGMLREDLAEEPERRGQIERIQKELDYLKRVVHDFLEYARWSLAEERPVDVVGLVDEVLELVGGEAAQGEVDLRGVSGDERAEAMCDGEPVRRVIMNLVRNGVQAAGRGGWVGVEVEREEREESDGRPGVVRIKVADSGPGVADEHVDKIFEPFYTTKQQGTGLGLALARKIVEAHGGALEVERDRGEGRDDRERGATFVLELPAAPGGGGSAEGPAGAGSERREKRASNGS
jgi:signal transduction histidine kinase